MEPGEVELIGALDDRDAAVVYYARQALVANTGQGMGYDVKPWLEWYQQTYAKATTQPATQPTTKG